MTVTADAIRAALICPKCKQRGTIRARCNDLAGDLAGGIALRLICDGEAVSAKRCGVLGDFVPPDPVSWSHMPPETAVAALQSFLDSTETADSTTNTLALARKNDRISALEAEIGEMAHAVHHAYHGAMTEFDCCACPDWTACPRAICRRAQRALGVGDGE